MHGKFFVKETGEFNSTAADMKLEQTINRSSKGKGGVIGATRKKRLCVYLEFNLS